MSDEKKSMAEFAREHARDLEARIEALMKLERANGSDDLDPDDWETIDGEFDVPDCDNCGHALSEHERIDEPIVIDGDVLVIDGEEMTDTILRCPDVEEGEEPTTFTLRDPSRFAEEVRERVSEWNYGWSTSIVVDVTLYGGGPAGGVEFHCVQERHGLALDRARVWHQDWFEYKGYEALDLDVAEYLFAAWGIEYAIGES